MHPSDQGGKQRFNWLSAVDLSQQHGVTAGTYLDENGA
jgi:hypothetical protein